MRNEKDVKRIKSFFEKNLTAAAVNTKGFCEQLYLFQSYGWNSFIRLDFLQYYRYSQKWFDLFSTHPGLLKVETASCIKRMHNLIGAHFNLMNQEKLAQCIKQFETFTRQKQAEENENNRILAYQYLHAARINLYFLRGTFTKGVRLVHFLEAMLK